MFLRLLRQPLSIPDCSELKIRLMEGELMHERGEGREEGATASSSCSSSYYTASRFLFISITSTHSTRTISIIILINQLCISLLVSLNVIIACIYVYSSRGRRRKGVGSIIIISYLLASHHPLLPSHFSSLRLTRIIYTYTSISFITSFTRE